MNPELSLNLESPDGLPRIHTHVHTLGTSTHYPLNDMSGMLCSVAWLDQSRLPKALTRRDTYMFLRHTWEHQKAADIDLLALLKMHLHVHLPQLSVWRNQRLSSGNTVGKEECVGRVPEGKTLILQAVREYAYIYMCVWVCIHFCISVFDRNHIEA